MIHFDGELVIVTGAANGQGAEEARLFAELGARVIVSDFDFDGAQAVAQSLGSETATPFKLDVANEVHWKALIEMAESRFGGIFGLVNNAGLFRGKRIMESNEQDVTDHFSVNQMGAYLGLRTAAHSMLKTGGGSIVNIASVAAIQASDTSTLYGMTKAAVVNLTRGAALELGPAIRVNCILPGAINTRMLAQSIRPFFSTIPLARIGEPNEVAAAAAFLISLASSYCTGATLVVDGGWSLGLSAKSRERLRESVLHESP
jgi:3alpha(or 20beta)-hydroxysteroid dehydrogenase